MQEITPTDIPSVKEYKVLSLQDLPEGLKLCDLALQCNAEALELKFLTPQKDTEGVKFLAHKQLLTAKKLRTHIRKTILNLSFLQNV